MTETTPPATSAPTGGQPPAWDFAQWLLNSRPPERSVVVCGRGDLLAEYEDLERQLAAANAGGAGGRLSGGTLGRREQRELAERMEAVRLQIEQSRLTLRVRALTADELRDIEDGLGDTDGDTPEAAAARRTRVARWISRACTSHSITPEQADAMRRAIGEGQYAAVWEAAYRAGNDGAVTVPFSPVHSAVMSRPVE